MKMQDNRFGGKTRATLGVVLLLSFSILTLTPTSTALAVVKQDVVGQVTFIERATIGGQPVGVVLSVEKGSTTPERHVPSISQLIMAPHADPATWKRIGINGSAPLLGVGDVDGDGQDDIALGFASGGGSCPAALVGYSPCGAILVFDGPALLNKEPLLIARIKIQPWAGPCPPAAYNPQAISLRDLDGDGKAELAFGQLGLYPGTCGVVHVFNGKTLNGEVKIDQSCARLDGPIVERQKMPDEFGVQAELFKAGGKSFVAIGAPQSSTDKPSAGRVDIVQLPKACAPGGGLAPETVHTYKGASEGMLSGTDVMFADGKLWISSGDKVEGIDATSFDSVAVLHASTEIPLGRPGDMNGDGKPDVFIGPTILTQDGGLVMHAGAYAQDSFRGAFIRHDELLASDNFGLRLWSLKDTWNPWLSLASSTHIARVGQVVNVSVAQMISLVPTPDPVAFVVLGANVVEKGPHWIHVRANAPGEIVVQASILKTHTVHRIPVIPTDEYYADVVGPDIVEVGHVLVARAFVPLQSTVTWEALGGSPASGEGLQVETTYSEIGPKSIKLHAVLPDGSTRDLEHSVLVFENAPDAPPLTITTPTSIKQGTTASVSVNEPVAGKVYAWTIEGRQVGVTSATGPELSFPVSGWSAVNLTVIEKENGVPTRIGNGQFLVENVPPEIVSVETLTTGGLKAKVATRDQGGDPVFTQWKVDGKEVGRGAVLELELPPGDIELTVIAQDVAGAAVRDIRHLTITSPWRVLPKRDPNSTSAPETTIDEYAWKVDRLKADPASAKEAGFTPGPDALLVFAVLLVTGVARYRSGRRERR